MDANRSNVTWIRVVQFQIPGPLGMIVAGIILANIQNGYIIQGEKPSWTKEFRGIALAAIFLRSGLELDLGVSYVAEAELQWCMTGELLIMSMSSDANSIHNKLLQ